jgi:hypothetical protein
MMFSLAPMCHHMNDQLEVNLTISIGLSVKITIEKSNVITCVILCFHGLLQCVVILLPFNWSICQHD